MVTLRYLVVVPGATADTTPSLGASLAGIACRLEAAQARLATLSQVTPHAEPHTQELHEIRHLVAALATDLLGAGHPIVSGLAGARVH